MIGKTETDKDGEWEEKRGSLPWAVRTRDGGKRCEAWEAEEGGRRKGGGGQGEEGRGEEGRGEEGRRKGVGGKEEVGTREGGRGDEGRRKGGGGKEEGGTKEGGNEEVGLVEDEMMMRKKRRVEGRKWRGRGGVKKNGMEEKEVEKKIGTRGRRRRKCR
ncbi:hypothetical protein Pcinc_026279 [Petrolisthes cinctipes]|uniref:Uncharacterized protein n=1 Tax=Petrolisthes cinctipes TaxID=88211 RepID=A0AAE1F6D9_PETCI|nr:hypothetical protein Pcinc_026279 [Petrolisthes cinctipes]